MVLHEARPETTEWRGGALSQSTKRVNRSAVLRAIAELDEAPRVTVSEMTGLSAATISRVVGELLRARLVKVAGSVNSSPLGRKSAVLRIDPGGVRIVGIHLGGFSNDVCLADLAGTIYAESHLPLIGDQSIDEVLPRVFEAVDGLLDADTNDAPIVGVGVATGGDVDPLAGRVLTHAQFGWRDVPLRDIVTSRYGVHCSIVNTFQGVAWYETLFSPDARGRSVLFVNCGALIGAGIALQSHIDPGTRATAGQLGHTRIGGGDAPCVCGKRGCLQAVASDLALQAEAAAQIPGLEQGHPLTSVIHHLGELAAAGDARARALFEGRARTLAPAIALLANTLSPALLMLGHSDHPYRDAEHRILAAFVADELYPPLRPRIRMRPLTVAAGSGGLRPAIAAVVRDFYSPALDLRPAGRRRLRPVITTNGFAAVLRSDRAG